MGKLFFIYLTLIIVLQSCSSENCEYTHEFNNYLKGVFNRSIPKETHKYILIPSNQCKNCIRLGVFSNNNHVTVITDKVDDRSKYTYIQYDTIGKLQSLKILDYQNTIIYTSDGEVQKVIHTPIDSILFY